MTESQRMDAVISAMRAAINASRAPLARWNLKRATQKRLPFHLMEGDFRSAMWRLVDGGVAKFTEDRRLSRTA